MYFAQLFVYQQTTQSTKRTGQKNEGNYVTIEIRRNGFSDIDKKGVDILKWLVILL